jgi:O-antigen/teichoic acid export membrane protein
MLKSGNDSNSRQAVWVGISSVSTFVIALASSVILARYFSKTEYGTYKQIVYVYNTFITLFSVGLPSAYSYFLPKLSKSEGKGIMHRLTRIFIILGIIYGLSLFLLSGLIADALRNPELERGLKLFSVVPLLMMPTLGLEGVYAAIRKTQVLALYTTITRLGMLIFIVLPVIIMKGTYVTAIYGWMVSSLLTFALTIHLKYRPFRGVKSMMGSISNKMIFQYSMPIMVASVSGVILRFADQFFLSRYFGTEVFADYSNGFIPLPLVGMITSASHAIFVPLFSGLMEKDGGKNSIALHWKSGVNKMILLIFPMLVFFMFYAKEVIFLLYGPLYDKSYIYFRLAMIVNFAAPFLFYSLLLSTGNTKIYAQIHIVYAVAIWALGFVVCKIGSTPYQYMILSVFLAVLSKFIGLIYAAKIIDRPLMKLIDLSNIMKLLLPCIVVGIISKELMGLAIQDIAWTFILGGVAYSALGLLADRLFHLNILNTALSFVKSKS